MARSMVRVHHPTNLCRNSVTVSTVGFHPTKPGSSPGCGNICGCGEMVDAADLKSAGLKSMRVRVSPSTIRRTVE